MLTKQENLQIEKAQDSQLCPVALNFHLALMVNILTMKLSLIFSHLKSQKRCSVTCANLNISPLKTVNCLLILNYLNEKNLFSTFKNYNLKTNMGIPCPLKGMVSMEPNEMVCSITLKP